MAFYVWKESPKPPKRPNWEVVWQQPPEGRRKRHAVPAGEDAAMKLVALAKPMLARGEPWYPPEGATEPPLQEMVNAFIDDVERAGKRNTLRRCVSDMSLFVQYLEWQTKRTESRLRGTDVTSDAMRGFWDWLLTPGTGASTNPSRGQATSRKALNNAYAFATWAAGQDRFREHIRVPGRFKLPQVSRPRTAAPTWEQMAACVEAVRAPWMQRAALLLYYTGLRIDLQVMHLWWEDFDLERGTLKLQRAELCKTAHEAALKREMPISPHLLAAIKGWAEKDGDGRSKPWLRLHGFVVDLRSSGRGRPKTARELRGRDMKRAWKRALGEYPDKWGKPNHCFRGGWNTGLRIAGVLKEVRQYMLGHKSEALVDSSYTDEDRAYWGEMQTAVRDIPPVELAAARWRAGASGEVAPIADDASNVDLDLVDVAALLAAGGGQPNGVDRAAAIRVLERALATLKAS
jgi:hypothetical protein